MPSAETTKHYWLYVLRLEQGKYYVGITSRKDPQERIQEHMDGFYSAQWVKKYKPIEPTEVIDLGNKTEREAYDLENHRVLQYMRKYGLQSVRGGKFNYSGRYVKVGDRFLHDEDFRSIITVLTLLLVVALMFITRFSR